MSREQSDVNMAGILHHINENYDQPMTMGQLAAQFYLSPATFSRYFTEFTGYKYTDYLNRIRIDHAREDLSGSDTAITDIALNHGFGSASVFTRIFQKYMDMTPSEYRRRSRSDQSSRPDPSVAPRYVHIHLSDLQTTLLMRPWLDAVNIGEAGYLQNPVFRQQLLKLRDLLGFKYVRIRDFLSAGLVNLYTDPVEAERTPPDFSMIDEIVDFLVEHHFLLWVDPAKGQDYIKKDTDLKGSLRLGSNDPYDLTFKYPAVLHLIRHWVVRYGADQINRWRFELWYDDSMLVKKETEDYVRKFEHFAGFLHHYAPDAAIGIISLSATGRKSLLRHLISSWPAGGCRPDFISAFCFPYLEIPDEEGIDPLRRTSFTRSVLAETEVLTADTGLEGVPVWLTEWDVTLTQRNAVNDSCARAAILLDNAEETLDHPFPIVLSGVSDLQYIQGDKNRTVFGGHGLITTDSYYKPVVYAMSFLRQLSGHLLAHEKGCIITTDRADSYELLLYNACPFPENYYKKPEYEITIDYVLHTLPAAGTQLKVDVRLPAEHTAYSLRQQYIRAGSSDLLGHLKAFGDISGCGSDDRDYLRHVIRPETTRLPVRSENGQLSLERTLAPYDICLITIKPIL